MPASSPVYLACTCILLVLWPKRGMGGNVWMGMYGWEANMITHDVSIEEGYEAYVASQRSDEQACEYVTQIIASWYVHTPFR